MLSPGLKVKDFYITDVQPFAIKLVWNISRNEGGYVIVLHNILYKNPHGFILSCITVVSNVLLVFITVKADF